MTTQPTGSVDNVTIAPTTPRYYYVLPIAGQSNAMAYGEGMPLPDTLDSPHPRIKQLARRATETPYGPPCHYNQVIALDHCPHDVQDMSRFTHPHADARRGEYGCVAQALHIGKTLLPYLPAEAGILIVPCARGGSAFTQGNLGAYHPARGATADACRWGVATPLYQDLRDRTRAALRHNPDNRLLAVIWMQGEFDLTTAEYAHQPALFQAMVARFRADMADMAPQMAGGRADRVPWICGDTCAYWQTTYPRQYATIYGAYRHCPLPALHFVPLMYDAQGMATPSNAPADDPDNPAMHYYGAASRDASNWTTALRAAHFSAPARRSLIPERLVAAILRHAQLPAETTSG